MSEQTVEQTAFDFFSRLPVVVEPTEAQLSSDVGILPLRQFDDQIGFTERFISCLNDPRDPDQIDHTCGEMARQRLYGILAGYVDCNDHDALRGDPVFKIVSGRAPADDDLASQPTLSRFENAVDIPSLWRLHDFFIDDFIRSFDRPPSFLTVDLDAVDDACHGQQQLALFNAFYDQYQYLPLVISCAETKQVLWCAVRPGNAHSALGADDDLEYIVNRLRAAWPEVIIHVRADGGFAVPWMYAVCEQLGVLYTIGLPPNRLLEKAAEPLRQRAVEQFEETREPPRLFSQFLYRAGDWKNFRRVVVKAECNPLGTNVRFVLTNRPGAAILPQATYDEYTERGESENRNKELKCGLSGDRLSCGRFVANYFRLMLHAAALNLLVRLRAVVSAPPTLLAHDDPAWGQLEREERIRYVPVEDPTLPAAALAQPERRRFQNYRRRKDPLGQGHIETWRLMLIKVAGEVIPSARRILIRVSARWPYLRWFQEVCRRLAEWRRGAQVQT